jgi:glycosyltransferase involved in cell wall biosynthesis
MRVAVVTPYFDESKDVLERCMASVRSQSVPADHILVADGNPQYWIEAHANVDHVVLRRSTADFGDTPRSIGFVVGMRGGYDIIQFLDADNLLLPDHFAVTLEHFRGRAAAEYPDVVVARRQMLRPDGSVIAGNIPEDDQLKHIDTSCYVFYRTAFPVGLKWSLIPRELAFMDDRVFFAILTQLHPDLRLAFNPVKTVG